MSHNLGIERLVMIQQAIEQNLNDQHIDKLDSVTLAHLSKLTQ